MVTTLQFNTLLKGKRFLNTPASSPTDHQCPKVDLCMRKLCTDLVLLFTGNISDRRADTILCEIRQQLLCTDCVLHMHKDGTRSGLCSEDTTRRRLGIMMIWIDCSTAATCSANFVFEKLFQPIRDLNIEMEPTLLTYLKAAGVDSDNLYISEPPPLPEPSYFLCGRSRFDIHHRRSLARNPLVPHENEENDNDNVPDENSAPQMSNREDSLENEVDYGLDDLSAPHMSNRGVSFEKRVEDCGRQAMKAIEAAHLFSQRRQASQRSASVNRDTSQPPKSVIGSQSSVGSSISTVQTEDLDAQLKSCPFAFMTPSGKKLLLGSEPETPLSIVEEESPPDTKPFEDLIKLDGDDNFILRESRDSMEEQAFSSPEVTPRRSSQAVRRTNTVRAAK